MYYIRGAFFSPYETGHDMWRRRPTASWRPRNLWFYGPKLRHAHGCQEALWSLIGSGPVFVIESATECIYVGESRTMYIVSTHRNIYHPLHLTTLRSTECPTSSP